MRKRDHMTCVQPVTALPLCSAGLRDRARAKYELVHSVRTHLGCEDDAFGCMGNGEDSEGTRGVFLRRNVIAVAGRALTANLTRLGPLVLPISELVSERLRVLVNS